MKKLIIGLLLIAMTINIVGCSDSSISKNPNLITITDDMYVTWVQEIHENAKDYIGKTVKIEGMYSSYRVISEDATYNVVYREGPGCCGSDGSMCGFEFEYDGELPKEEDWIEVEGTVGYYEVNGKEYLTLKDSKVSVKEVKGETSISHNE